MELVTIKIANNHFLGIHGCVRHGIIYGDHLSKGTPGSDYLPNKQSYEKEGIIYYYLSIAIRNYYHSLFFPEKNIL